MNPDIIDNKTIGDYIIIKESPCKITQKKLTKSGQIHVIGKDIITDKLHEDIYELSTMVCMPFIKIKSHHVDKIDRNNIFIYDENNKSSECIPLNMHNKTDVDMLIYIQKMISCSAHNCYVDVLYLKNVKRLINCVHIYNSKN